MDQFERITLDVDDKQAVAATGRASRGMADFEKSSESAAMKAKLAFSSAGRAMEDFAAQHKVLIGLTLSLGEAYVTHRSKVDLMVDGYRGLRLALSPTPFTAATLAVGALTVATIELTNSRAKLIEQDALQAAQSKRDFGAVSTFSTAERIGGLGAGALNKTTAGQLSPAKLAEAIDDFHDLADPIDKADLAVKTFGADAGKILPILDRNLKSNIERSFELSQALNGPVRESLARIRETLQEPGIMLKGLVDDLRGLREQAKQNITIVVTTVERRVRQAFENPPSTSVKGLGSTESFEPGFGLNAGGPIPDKIPSALELDTTLKTFGKDFLSQIGGPVSGLSAGAASPAITDRARQTAAAFENSGAVVAGKLSAARGRLDNLVHQFEAGDEVAKAAFATSIAQVQREVDQLIPRVAYFSDIAEKVAKEISSIKAAVATQEAATEKLFAGATEIAGRNPVFGPEIEAFNLKSAGDAFTAAAMNQILRSRGVPLAGPARAGDINDLVQRQDDADKAHLRSIDMELAARSKILDLQAGPGGERAAAEQIYQIKVAAANAELDVLQKSKEYEPYKEKIAQAGLDLQVQLVSIEKEHFDTIKRDADQLFDSMLGGARSFGDALKRVLIAGFLTPIKEGFSNFVASALTGRKVSFAGGAGGGVGGLGSLFGLGLGGFGLGGAPGGTSGFGGPVSLGGLGSGTSTTTLSGIGGTGIGGGGSGVAGAASQVSLLANFKGQLAKLGNLGSGFSAAHGGVNGAAGGALLGIGGGLAFDGLRRGGVGGLLETTAGGAAIGFKFGGPIGALIGAAVGAIAGTVRLFIKGATDKIVERVKSVYGVTISKSFASDPLLPIIKQQFGGNIDVGIRSPQIRDLIQLYRMSTDQGNGGPSPFVPQAATFSQGGGGLSLLPIYSNGAAFFPSSQIQAGGAAPVTIQSVQLVVNGQPAADVLEGRIAPVVANSPGAVSKAMTSANLSSQARRSNAVLSLTPGTVTTS